MVYRRLTRLILLIIGVVVFNSGCAFTRDLFKRTPMDPSEVFDRTSSMIEKYYIDKSGNSIKLDRSKRPDVMSLVAQLDRSTEYYSPEESTSLMPSKRGAAGIALKLKDESIEIQSTMLRAPARKAGLRKGDKIVEINDISVAGQTMPHVLSMLQGPVGSEVKFKIITPPGKERIVRVTREIIKPFQLVVQKMSENNLGYLRIEQFGPGTSDRVKEEIEQFLEGKVKGLILDIRNNGGGLFSAITEVAQLFLKDGAVICTLRKNDGKEDDYWSGGWRHHINMPVVVLIDGNTANGAEILAASLKDNRRALLVGETSAGMVEIHTVFPLGDGSFLRLRTALASRATGDRFNEHGIAADREIILTEEERASIYTQIETAVDGYVGNNANDRQVKVAVGILVGADGIK